MPQVYMFPPSKMFFVLAAVLVSKYLSASRCTFNVVVTKLNISMSTTTALIECVGDSCEDYYARINFSCNGLQPNAVLWQQSLLGFQPQVIVVEKRINESNKYFVDAFIVKKSERLCYPNIGDDSDAKHHLKCDEAASFLPLELSEIYPTNIALYRLSWLAKLPVTELTDNVKIVVSGNGMGQEIPERVSVTYLKAFSLKYGSKKDVIVPLDEVVTERLSSVKKSYSGDWYSILKNNHLMVSNTEFDITHFVKIDVEKAMKSHNHVCTRISKEVMDVLFLSDNIFISTKYGVIEITHTSQDHFKLIFKKCLNILVTIGSSDQMRRVLGIDKTNNNIYWKSFSSDVFTELKNTEGAILSEWMNNHFNAKLSEIVDMQCLVGEDYTVMLLEIGSDRTDKRKVYNIIYVTLKKDGWHFQMNGGNVIGDFVGISLANSLDIFLWGRDVYHSTNGGNMFTPILYDRSMVLMFASSKYGNFIFQTDSLQVWYGVRASAHARILIILSLQHFSSFSYVFNSEGKLKEILLHNNETAIHFISREVTAIAADVIKGIIWDHNTCSYNSKCQFGRRSQEKDFAIQRTCVFYRISVSSSPLEGISRIPYSLLIQQSRGGSIERTHMHADSSKEYLKDVLYSDQTDGVPLTFFSQVKDPLTDIFIGFNECVRIYIRLGVMLEGGLSPHFWEYDDFKLNINAPSFQYVNVTTSKQVSLFHGIVSLVADICDTGNFSKKVNPGAEQLSTLIILQIFPLNLQCVEEEETRRTNIVFSVHHGCPSRRKIEIDFTKSRGGYEHYCRNENNCFLFELPFTPVFIILDEVNGKKDTYDNLYELRIVGHGTSEKDIVLYDEKELVRYNEERGATQIWSWLNNVPSEDGIQWLCHSASPCSPIIPEFYETPFVYFKIQFSNVNVPNTNCNYTFDFVIKLHGMPPHSLFPALVIVVGTAVVILIQVLFLFVMEKRYPKAFSSFVMSISNTSKYLVKCVSSSNRVQPVSVLTTRKKVEDWMTMNEADGVTNIIGTQERDFILLQNKDASKSHKATSMTHLNERPM